MARMNPEDIEGLENVPEGERKVFRFLREAARPDQRPKEGLLIPA